LPVIIEPMFPADLPAVMTIEIASFTEPWSVQSFRSELANNKSAAYLVARMDGVIAGYGGIWLIMDEAHITTLAVEESCRRRGIASRLLADLIAQAVQMGARRVLLEVRPSNHPARSLYERFGFSVVAVRRRYYLDEDGLLMVKEIPDGRLSSYEPCT
jgi:ribosomal-protein-alanine N-acetyltransferase